jgi:hypothetical protein
MLNVMMQSALSDYREQLAIKHPGDEHKEFEVKLWLAVLDDSQMDVLDESSILDGSSTVVQLRLTKSAVLKRGFR